MALPAHKTKIVCTIGPASESVEVIEKMILAGMNVARLNFSHGSFDYHRKIIENVREASRRTSCRVALLADLPGPKIRIGMLSREPIELEAGQEFTLTTAGIKGDDRRADVSNPGLSGFVKAGDVLYLNDGYVQLEVIRVQGEDIHCRVTVGGEIRSRVGLNLPGVRLGMRAFTDYDRKCLEFAAGEEVDAVSQSFVETAEDILAVRQAAGVLNYHPFIIAKIERSGALTHIEEILGAADCIMIARGDLGVEIPIERIAIVQKDLMRRANLLGKPVITATQMLESMTTNKRPTRAEATDVANAVLDGTDCVMLSGESAIGKYPVDAVSMLARIAAATEPGISGSSLESVLRIGKHDGKIDLADLIAMSVRTTFERVTPVAVFVPTQSGATARSITRFHLPVWIIGMSSQESTCQRLQFSFGVYPVCEAQHPEDWRDYIRKLLEAHGVKGDLVILTEGPSLRHPDANHRMEIIDLKGEK
jgi:pyruvate kinase